MLNAIAPQTTREELEAIREAGVTSAILMAQNETDYSPFGRVTVLRDLRGREDCLKSQKRRV